MAQTVVDGRPSCCQNIMAAVRQRFLAALSPPEQYETASGGQWITIGGGPGEGGKQHVGGTPVKVAPSGKIAAGPASLRGKPMAHVDQNKERQASPSPSKRPPSAPPSPKATDKLAAAFNALLRQYAPTGTTPAPVRPEAIAKLLQESAAPPTAPGIVLPGERQLQLRPGREERRPTGGRQKPLFDVAAAHVPSQRDHEPRQTSPTPPLDVASGPAQLTPDQIEADPSRFQYKITGIDPRTGVTKQLDDSKKYNPLFGGQLLVWRDPANQRTYVINGHHRLHLAKRSGFNGPMSVFYIDAKNAQEARAIGALANIAGGNGTATDAAKFMRDTGTSVEEMRAHGVSVSGRIARDAVPLARLHGDLFQRLTNGLMTEDRALAIARHVTRPEAQKALADIIEAREAKGKPLAQGTVEEMAKEMEIAGTRTESGSDLFGSFAEEKSTFVERGEIKAYIRRQLAEDKNAFRAVSRDKRNTRLAEAGNVLNTEENQQRADMAARALMAFDTLANLKGPLSDAINAAAEDYGSSPKKRASIFKTAYASALEHVRGELAGDQPGEQPVDAPAAIPAGQDTAAYQRGANAGPGGGGIAAGPALTAAFSAALEQYARRAVAPSPGQMSLGMGDVEWDESKHPRDHGKFAPKGTATVPGVPKPAAAPLAPFALQNAPTPKPKAPPVTPTGGHQGSLFQTGGLPGQKNLFADRGVPAAMVQKPHAGELATALARGDDHTAHLHAFASAAETAGLSGEEASAHAREAIEQHYPAANSQGHDTQARHKTATGEYTPQRRMLHDRIVSHALHGVATGQAAPEMHFMGGGPAAGKTSVIESGQVALPQGHALIDPDEIKKAIPEYAVGSHLRDKHAAAFAHEESSDLAAHIRDTAVRNRSHVVVDGTGDSGYQKMAAKVQAAKDAGYKAVAHYVTVDTDEAVRRAMARAQKTGRMVPEQVIRDTHRAVSQIVPQAIQNGLFDHLSVYDTQTDPGTPPVKIAEAHGKQLTVHDAERWAKFLAKGS